MDPTGALYVATINKSGNRIAFSLNTTTQRHCVTWGLYYDINATECNTRNSYASSQLNETKRNHVPSILTFCRATTLGNKIFYDDATLALSSTFKVWVGGLGEEGTRLELEVAFEAFGPVKNIWLAKNPPSFAFIEMEVKILCTTQIQFLKLYIRVGP